MHSASWDPEYDLTEKTVAVIGGGSSAVQIIPSIQPKVKKLVPYLRSPVWITAGFGAKYAAPGGENFKCESPVEKNPRHAWLTDGCRFREAERGVQDGSNGVGQIQ